MAGVLILSLVMPLVSASTRTIINPGAEVFIGEQGLDIAGAMVGADTNIAWWPAAADPYTTAPSKVIAVGSLNNFYVAPSEFVGYYGNWYSYNGTPPGPDAIAFVATDPVLEPGVSVAAFPALVCSPGNFCGDFAQLECSAASAPGEHFVPARAVAVAGSAHTVHRLGTYLGCCTSLVF